MKVQTWVWGVATIAYMGLIFYLSSDVRSFPVGFHFSHADKVIHFFAYSVLGGLVAGWMGSWLQMPFWGWWLGFMIGSLYGVSDEIHQFFVPGRNGDALDAIADAFGACFGAFFVVWVSSRRFFKEGK